MAKTADTTTTVATIEPEAIAAIQKATLEAMRIVQAPENRNPPPAYWNGYGLPDFPKSRWQQIVFCGAKVEPRQCTREELSLFNQITTPGMYGPDKDWKVEIHSSSGKPVELWVSIPRVNTIEGRMGQPTLVETLRTIVREQNGE